MQHLKYRGRSVPPISTPLNEKPFSHTHIPSHQSITSKTPTEMFVQTNIAHTQRCMSDRKICTTPQLGDRNRLAGKWKSRHCSLVAKK